ncbi:MAG: glycosyltransferase family 2 protein [Microbacterium sp.]
MTVTVIYVAYRTPKELLQRSIDSIVESADAASTALEVLVVDNGGAAEYAHELRQARVVGDGENLGFGHAVNVAVRLATGDHVLLMNPDSTADRALLSELLSVHQQAQRPTMLGALLVKGGRPQIHAYNLWWSSLGLAWHKQKWATELDAVVERGAPTQVARLCGAGLFATRKVLDELGPFDEDFFLYGEDVDLSLRAASVGLELVLVPRALIDHDAGTSSEGSSALVERARTDAHLRLVVKHRGYAASLLARLESIAVTLLGALAARSSSARAARLGRLTELRRWGLSRIAAPFSPNSRVS